MKSFRAKLGKAAGWLFTACIGLGCVGCAVWFFVWAWRGAISAIVGA